MAALLRLTPRDRPVSADARHRLVRATIETIAEHGFEGLSVRGVAARAEVSVGAVQHHFPTKTAMLDAAMTAIASLAVERSSDLASLADPAERVHALIDVLIPSGEANSVARVWLAFTARATVDEGIRTAYVQLWARMRNEIRLLIAAASGRPETAELAARELLALVDGFAVSVIAEGQDSAVARRIAHQRLDGLIRGDA